MDGLTEQDAVVTATARDERGTGEAPGAAGAVAVADAGRVRLFGAAYRMLGSAREAQEIVRAAVAGHSDGGRGAGPGAGSYDRLVREVTGAAVRRAQAALRGRRDGHAGAWLPEPVLTGGGVLGPLESADARESVSMARLVLLERLSPLERAAFVLGELFGYEPADTAEVLGTAEARCRLLLRRARQRIGEGEGVFRTGATGGGPEQRWSVVEELLRAVREQDLAALEEIVTDDVVAWSDGGWQPGVARRPVLGAGKVGRFLAGLPGRAPQGTTGTVAEVNGDPAVVATAGERVVGVLVPEFGERGLVGLRSVAEPARLEFFTRQWEARAPR
jgi:hypothetical protein